MEKRIRIEFDEGKCIGAKVCVGADPSQFGFDDAKQHAVLLNGQAAGAGKQVAELVLDEKKARIAIDAASACPVNAFVVTDLGENKTVVTNTLDTSKTQEVKAQYDDAKEFVLDPKGYFLIRIIPEKKEMEVGFCDAKNQMVLKVTGKTPIEVYQTIANKVKLDLRNDHYAYLGRELQKAYHCLQAGLKYVQDDELHTMQPHP